MADADQTASQATNAAPPQAPRSLDDILGPAPEEQTRSLDDILGPGTTQETMQKLPSQRVFAAEGRIMDAFGQGFKQVWGAEPLGMAPETEDFLTKAGLLKDYKSGHFNIVRTLNDALVRPLANGLAIADTALSAGFSGVQAAVAQTGTEVGLPGVGREAAAMVESGGGLMGSPGALHIPAPEALPPDLARARSLGVIGEGEAGWKGTAEPTPETEEARAEAVKAEAAHQQETPPEEQPASEAGGPVTETEAAPEPAPDIHAVARQIDPTTFREYDALAQRKQTFLRWIDELGAQREQLPQAQALRDQIDGILNKVGGVEDKLTKSQAGRLDEARSQLDDLLTTDTPDMRRVRQALQQTDYRMRDLAPDVTAAYRQAQEQMPATEEPVEEPQPAAQEAAGAPQEVPATTEPSAAPEPIAGAPAAPAAPPEEEPKVVAATGAESPETRAPAVRIEDDVSQKLVAAGRPQEEADAAAAIVQAHYEARASRLGTSAQELYAKEAPAIESAPRGRKGELGRTVVKDGQATIRLMANADASTFIHETGHSWLEELQRDAEDERAVPEVKADAQTVRDWLGAKEGEAITRAQHEKFARGFERYLMEGVAPSKGLAAVFAKFKDWLTTIYQTVAKLRAPITDDIRDVFDRLLSANPERQAIIAGEKEAPKAFADRHEELAETTPPDKAAEVADTIRAEADAEAQKEPKVAERLNPSGPGGEAGGNAPESAEPHGDGDAGRPLPAGTGNGEEPGAVGAGGGEAAPQGAGGTTTAERPRTRKRSEPPAGPNALFPEPESDLVDKAGNIRLDNLNTPEDVNEVIRETARQGGDFIGARRGIISDAQVLDLADALGMDPAQLSARKLGQAFNAEQIMAARKLLIQSAASVRDAMIRAADDNAADSDAAVMAYAEAKARHMMIQEQVSGITAEAGRALRAFRDLEGAQEAKALGEFLEHATGQTLFQLRREAKAGAGLDTPQKVSKFVNDSKKPGFGDMILEYWINGLISGPATHTTYSIGNALLALWKAGPETGMAAAIGAIRHALGGEGERVYAGEVPAQLFGMIRGLPQGVVAAWQAVKTGQTTLLPGERAAMTARQIANSPLVNPRAAIPDFLHVEVAGRQIPLLPLGTAVRLPSRAIAAIHSFFRSINYTREMAASAYRTASEEGLEGDAFSKRVGEITTNPDTGMMQRARASATDLTLMGRGGELTQALSRLTNARFLGFQWLKFIDPFVHISSNVIEQSLLKRTPLGVLVPEIRADLAGTNGTVARDMAVARMVAGSALGVAIGSLAAQGLVSGSGPSDPREAAMWRLAGNQAHSIRVGDMWYDVHRLGPLGMILGVAADLYDVGHAISQEDGVKVASMISHALTQNILDESFMRGPAELIQALSDPDRYGQGYVRNFATSFVPYSVGMAQVARATDPYSRQARTILDAVKAKIPAWSETLFPRRDIWGEPIPSQSALIASGVTAIYEQKVGNDPVNKTMLALGIHPGLPERKIRGVQLTDQQYDDFSRIAGRMAKMQLDRMVADPNFSLLPQGVQRDMIGSVIKGARETARGIVMMQSRGTAHDIVATAVKAKQDQLKGPATVH